MRQRSTRRQTKNLVLSRLLWYAEMRRFAFVFLEVRKEAATEGKRVATSQLVRKNDFT